MGGNQGRYSEHRTILNNYGTGSGASIRKFKLPSGLNKGKTPATESMCSNAAIVSIFQYNWA
jgi:hypothetical protein